MTVSKQPGSKMCFLCGVDNPIGLHLDFWTDGEQVWTDFTPREEHQGWPGVVHGGILATVLDETMGRVAFLHKEWMVTVRMETTFRRPATPGQPLRVTAHAEQWRGGRMTAIGQVLLADGSVAVEAHALYLRVPDTQKDAFLADLAAQGMDVGVYQ